MAPVLRPGGGAWLAGQSLLRPRIATAFKTVAGSRAGDKMGLVVEMT